MGAGRVPIVFLNVAISSSGIRRVGKVSTGPLLSSQVKPGNSTSWDCILSYSRWTTVDQVKECWLLPAFQASGGLVTLVLSGAQ
ncbi:hypothetical protein PAMA_011090 [Pampus argenteus]